MSGRHRTTCTDKTTVLLIRLDAIGDFVLWLDAAQELRNIYPVSSHRLVLIANSSWAQFAATLPYFDVVVSIDRTKFFQDRHYRRRHLAAIQQLSPDIAIHPAYSRELLFGDAIIRTCGAPQRISPVGDTSRIRPWLKPLADQWYTTLLVDNSLELSELNRTAEFIRELGNPTYQPRLSELPVNNQDRRGEHPYLVVVPGALMAYRRWPVVCFVELVQRIQTVTGWNIVLCGGPGEESLGQNFAQLSTCSVDNRIGSTTLEQLISIIAGAKLVLSNETAAVHIATAVATPAVCILGGGHYGRFMPYPVELASENRPIPVPVQHPMECYGCNWQCSYPVKSGEPMPCIARITVDDVWKSVKTLLSPEFG